MLLSYVDDYDLVVVLVHAIAEGFEDAADTDHPERVESAARSAPMLDAPNTCTPVDKAWRISLCQTDGTCSK